MAIHRSIQASDLQPGDVMQCGVSTNYVLIGSAAVVGGRVRITIDGSPEEVVQWLGLDQTVRISRRNYPLERA